MHGHEVKIIATGDSFKNYNVDYSITPRFFHTNWLPRKIKNGIHYFFKIDSSQFETALRFYLLLPKLKDFDHVQLVNSDALETFPFLSRILYKKLFQKIQSRSLLICGDESPIVDYLLKQELEYSILTPYFENEALKKHFQYTLKYQSKSYQKTFHWLNQNCQHLITSDMDYYIPMKKMDFDAPLIANPINTDAINYIENPVKEKIVIFLGINRGNYIKKGIVFFEEALEIIKQKYTDKIEIIISENLPYINYISHYNRAHIVLDQVFAFDQGYNALEAMAKGKVVFTGASIDFLEQYHLKVNEVCINALPDAVKIAENLSYLIEHPEKIDSISKKAREFIEKEHHYKVIAEKYLKSWLNTSFL